MEDEQELTIEERIVNAIWRIPARISYGVCWTVALFFMVLVCVRALIVTPARKTT